MKLTRALSALRPIWTGANDAFLGIRTAKSAKDFPVEGVSGRPPWRAGFDPGALHDDGNAQASPDYWYLYKILRMLRPEPEDVFYDLGAGKGRIVCLMARRQLRKCIGIELCEPLCDEARWNAAHLRTCRTPIEIVCGDAAEADLSDGTIYFMYNPFGAATMRRVLDNIEESLRAMPRRVKIVYHNALLASLLKERSWLEEYHSFSTAGGADVRFWRSRVAAAACRHVPVAGYPRQGI